MELVVGKIYECEYDTGNVSSTQGRGRRRIKLMESPHTELHFKKGLIVRVKDLSDPVHPGKQKVFYLKKFLKMKPAPAPTLSGAIWKKRGRFDKRQRNARRVVWTDSDDDE